jgi:hypothetical protein
MTSACGGGKFDLIVACECYYISWSQPILIKSIVDSLSAGGVALVSYSQKEAG